MKIWQWKSRRVNTVSDEKVMLTCIQTISVQWDIIFDLCSESDTRGDNMFTIQWAATRHLKMGNPANQYINYCHSELSWYFFAKAVKYSWCLMAGKTDATSSPQTMTKPRPTTSHPHHHPYAQNNVRETMISGNFWNLTDLGMWDSLSIHKWSCISTDGLRIYELNTMTYLHLH